MKALIFAFVAGFAAVAQDNSTPQWEIREFVEQSKTVLPNPFLDASLVGEFVSPSGKTNRMEGFYDGDQTWRVRFAPNEPGEWRYSLKGKGIEISRAGTFDCGPPRSRGFIRVHPQNPYAFAYEDGSPFFPMGDTCYGLLDDSPITPALRAEYLKTRRQQGFNFVRMHVSQSRERGAKDQTYWPWGGDAKNPDFDRLNPKHFQELDRLFRQMRSNEMNVELILLNFYQSPINNPRLWTAERNRLWLRYITARYGPFDNLFLWTIANEYENHPDGQYRLDFPGDLEWAKATARMIKEFDAFDHLVTVHPVVSASRKGQSPRSEFNPPWRIGEFFGEGTAIDVLSQQTGTSGPGTKWDDSLQCWTGDDKHLVASVNADRRYQKPVLNTEFGYEYLRGQPTEKQQVHHTDKVRRSAWRIVCAGGYIAAGFNGTIGHSDVWNRLDAPNRYDFIIRDEGAAKQLGHLKRFFEKLPYWRMMPLNEPLGLHDAEKTFVILLPHGGEASINLPSTTTFAARWFNPRTGEFIQPFEVRHGPNRLTALDSKDWAILIEAK